MEKYKICVYAICKNEEKFVDRFMDQADEADLVVVADTGSTDNTMQKLRDKGARGYGIDVNPFRFDYSRNKCLEFVPDDVDICVSADLDEVFEKGWREKLEKAWQKGATCGTYLMNWSFHEDGTPVVQYIITRVHARHGYKWVYPAHEVLEYVGHEKEKKVFIEGMVCNHHPDRIKSRSFYLPLLELAVEENPDTPRNFHYLGREYMYCQMWDKCIKENKKYLSLPNATWPEERGASMRFIAKAYINKGNDSEAKKWLYRAIAEAPWVREGYVEMASLAYSQHDWPGVFYFARQALLIKEKNFSFVNENFAWDATPYDLAALGSYYIGLKEEARNFSETAMQMSPNNQRLRNNHKYYTMEE